jgi:hypothetical protein
MVLKESFSIFFIIILNFINFSESNNCNCTKMSHEEHFCDSDFVMKVFVKSVEDEDENDIIYRVDVIKIFEKNNRENGVQVHHIGHSNEKEKIKNQSFGMKTVEKMAEKSKETNLSNIELFLNDNATLHIYATKHISGCGRRLNVGKFYIITGWIDGFKARTSSCYYAKEPQEMTLKETLFFLLAYKKKDCKKIHQEHHDHHKLENDPHYHHHYVATHIITQVTTAVTTEEPCDESTTQATTAGTTEEPYEESTTQVTTAVTTDEPRDESTAQVTNAVTTKEPYEESTTQATTAGTTEEPYEESTTQVTTAVTTKEPYEGSTTEATTAGTTEEPYEESTTQVITALTTEEPRDESTAQVTNAVTTEEPYEESTTQVATAVTTEEPRDESTTQATTAGTAEERYEESTNQAVNVPIFVDHTKKEEALFPKKPELSNKQFICPREDISRGCKRPQNCLYPNPISCYTFIQCVPKSDGSGTPVVMLCPAGLEWNNRKKKCDFPQFSTCLKDSK